MHLPTTTRARTALMLLGAAVFASALALSPLATATPAYAAAPISQCNANDPVYSNNASATEIECRVSIVNTLNLDSDTELSVVTVSRCIGAPAATLCSPPVTTTSNTLTTSVTQCNGNAIAGGSTIRCNVNIQNTVVGATSSAAPATVNQCVGSGTGGGIGVGGVAPALNCDLYQSATNATITQCNGSGNGGGGDYRVTCRVGSSTQTSVIPILVNQCNGSAYGGGDTVTCSTNLTNRLLPSQIVTPTPTPTPTVPAPTPTPTTPPVVTPPTTPGTPGTPTTPVTPGTPTTPVTPGTPGTPVTPVTPGTPGTPVVPGTPTAPVTPVTPGTPTTPVTPGTPTTPATPTTPVVTPGTPVQVAPNVVTPVTPVTPAVEAERDTLASTGIDVVFPTVIGLLTIAIGGAMALVALLRRGVYGRRN
ncbi:hypothetical protein GCM10027029_24390 [Conyzicola lurida]